ncbi:MAG: AraC family transcriptional regulator [Flavobacterium sp.]|jgi:AraC-like DNA-binding protein|uniref:AraC family transcriptional regulator n=1 Tax=Flavobacterium sp. TaxID=239 RepID=UPI0022C56542|nr:AraC family transcriptional regulator [Flavobacterium sp.]MCZ8168523.1 AraC family transcriptional regulator [Flavobacterium sp.]MCZ8298575.1 AraC family transcriptional regulator [Flavobacterium sp.]
MKPIFENIPHDKGASSFHAYRIVVPFFEFKWHFHPEYELTYIVKGSGYRLVGNTYEDFQVGDLVLLGRNVPHTWSGKSLDGGSVEAVVIQFGKEPMQSLLASPEGAALHHLFNEAAHGVRFPVREVWIEQLNRLLAMEGMLRMLHGLALLEELAQAPYERISPNPIQHSFSPQQELRINTICRYIMNHFSDPLTVEKVATVSGMSTSNFCKFFKKATGKTFSDYVNEIRIQEACILLRETERKISTVASDCGFETLSYFNRVFLTKKKCRPMAYRKYFLRR